MCKDGEIWGEPYKFLIKSGSYSDVCSLDDGVSVIWNIRNEYSRSNISEQFDIFSVIFTYEDNL